MTDEQKSIAIWAKRMAIKCAKRSREVAGLVNPQWDREYRDEISRLQQELRALSPNH